MNKYNDFGIEYDATNNLQHRDKYSPETFAYFCTWESGEKDVYTIGRLLHKDIETGTFYATIMGERLSPAEFVALYEWLPINQREESETRVKGGKIVNVRFRLEMTARQRNQWFN